MSLNLVQRISILGGFFLGSAFATFRPAIAFSQNRAGTEFPSATTTPASGPLDINTATPAQLRALPGMGDAYVKRIIDGRPYTAKNQLVTRGVLPQTAYERIREGVVAHRLARPYSYPGSP